MVIPRGSEKIRKETRFQGHLKGWERRVSWSMSQNTEGVVCNVKCFQEFKNNESRPLDLAVQMTKEFG